MTTENSSYQSHRFPAEIISHAVWLPHRFCLCFCEVEELLVERRIIVTYESVRQWCLKFAPAYARRLKKRQGRLGDAWKFDEAVITIQGVHQYLSRAVDQDGDTIHREVMPSVEHINKVYANNQVEVSHQPTRQQEYHMCGFSLAWQAQRFLTLHGLTQNLFCLGRHLMQAVNYRLLRTQSFQI